MQTEKEIKKILKKIEGKRGSHVQTLDNRLLKYSTHGYEIIEKHPRHGNRVIFFYHDEGCK